MKFNLLTNRVFLLSLEICLLSFSSTLIYQQIHVWHPCLFVFSIYIYTVIAFLNNCLMHGEFPSDAWLNMNAREKIFQRWNKCIFNKNLWKLWLEFSLNILKLKKTILKKILYNRNEFYDLQTDKFWVIFLLMMSNITSLQGHSSESFIT